MLEKIKKLRIEAIKNKDVIARNTYEAIYSAAQTLKGREGVSFVIDDARVIDLIKKEIKIYNEMAKDKDVTKELELLNALLPKQLTEEEIISHLNDYKATLGKLTPKDFMLYLDEVKNLQGQYDKGLVAKIVMKKD